MVGKRNRSTHSANAQTTGRSNGNAPQNNNDLESGPVTSSGNGNKPKLFKFRDIAHTALEDSRREELKNQLLFGLKEVDIERFRKSDKDVRLTCILLRLPFCAMDA